MAGESSGRVGTSQARTVLRENPGRGPAKVLVEANDRLQRIRSLLAGALPPADTAPPRPAG